MQKKSRAPWDRIRKEVVADDWGPENVKVANDIYRRLAAISPGDWIEKEDLYAAHRGDDSELDDGEWKEIITQDEFLSWLEAQHDEKNALGAGSGVMGAGQDWFARQIFQFRGGVIHLEIDRFHETEAEPRSLTLIGSRMEIPALAPRIRS